MNQCVCCGVYGKIDVQRVTKCKYCKLRVTLPIIFIEVCGQVMVHILQSCSHKWEDSKDFFLLLCGENKN